MSGNRIAVHFDSVAVEAFSKASDLSGSEMGLGFIRIVSTPAVLQKMIGEDDAISAGDWMEVRLTPDLSHPGPWAWTLQLLDNRFVGDALTRSPTRAKLISIIRLSQASQPRDPQSLGAAIPSTRIIGRELKRRYSLANIHSPISPGAANSRLRLWSRAWGASQVLVLDVGQASFNVISPSIPSFPTLYFDVGAPIWLHIHSIPSSFSPPQDSGGFVILSHWDSDHYAYGRQNPEFHEKTWFAPAQTSVGPNAYNFALYLYRRNRLRLVGKGFSTRPRRGARIIRCSGNSINGSGLSLHLRTLGREILLTGDADYNEIPGMGGIELSGLLVPHHGGKLAPFSVVPKAQANAARAVVSCGLPNRYGHPDVNTLRAHLDAGWNVSVTAGFGSSPRGPRKL